MSANGQARMELSASSKAAQVAHAATLQQAEMQRRGVQLAVPAGVEEVKLALRSIGEPITLFGEGPAERRDRLRNDLARASMAMERGEEVNEKAVALLQRISMGGRAATDAAAAEAKAEEDATTLAQLVYSPASQGLVEARKAIAQFSFERARQRLQQEAALRDPATSRAAVGRRRVAAARTLAGLRSARLTASQLGDKRPLCHCRWSPDGAYLLAASWSGIGRVWDGSDLASAPLEIRGHADRLTSAEWHPGSRPAAAWADAAAGTAADGADGAGRLPVLSAPDTTCPAVSASAVNIATGSADGTVGLWSLARRAGDGSAEADGEEASAPRLEQVGRLQGHQARLAKVAFHPSGSFVASASFDHTWRLWDLETQQELLLQDGHNRPVYGIAMHPDGSLVATADLGGNGRLWDLRSGKSVLPLVGHVRQVLGLDFSPDGRRLASGSDDHTVRIWDLRGKSTEYIIPAHCSMVSSVRWSPSGEVLLSTSFDRTIRVWSGRDFSLVHELAGHEEKVYSADCHPGNESILASCGFDRTVKLWTPSWDS